jgi:hypothetical protein
VLPAKQKDDELPLFSDMQKVERENFLLEPSEDFDDSIGNAYKCHSPPSLYSPIVLLICFYYLPFLILSFFPSAKLSYFSEVKLGVSIPARGESHDLLDVDGDKNDCEWYAH